MSEKCPKCFSKLMVTPKGSAVCVSCNYTGKASTDLIKKEDQNREQQRKKEEQRRKEEQRERRAEEEQHQQDEEERKGRERRTQGVASALKKEIDSGNDYLGITSITKMTPEKINCPECGAEILAQICNVEGRLVREWQGGETCSNCGFEIKTKEGAESVENSFWKDLCEELDEERKSNNDYVGLDCSLREKADKAFSQILSIPLNEWKNHHVLFFRTMVSFPQREKYFSLFNEKKSENRSEIQKASSEPERMGQADTNKVISNLPKKLDDADLESATLFVNPKNGWTVEVSPLTGLWYFLFGVFYLFYKGLIQEGCLILIANACLLSFTDNSGDPSPGLVCILVIHVILSLMAKGIMKRRYLEKGWHIK